MKHWLILGLLSAVVAGCNKTTTVGTRTSTRSGETVVTRLTLTSAKDHTIARGDTDKVTIAINRDNFNEPVTITISDLPTGVTVVEKELVIPAGENSVTANLQAAKDAPAGEKLVTITAEAKGVEKNTQQFRLTVK